MKHSGMNNLNRGAATTGQYVSLRAGRLEMNFRDGCIRWIRLGNLEIVRMIYIAARDRNWGTLKYRIENLDLAAGSDHFTITFSMLFGRPLVFTALCTLTGKADNSLHFRFDGMMNADFESNRIGFCVLHPVKECKGKPCIITHTGGETGSGVFPENISPHQPFKDIKAMAWSPAGNDAQLQFSGDVFEMEDQRNWTDASYKTYCTPLERPFPVLRRKGTRIRQAVELKVSVNEDMEMAVPEEGKVVRMTIGHSSAGKLPSIGVLFNPGDGLTTDDVIDRLKNDGISHIRYDVHFSRPDWRHQLEKFISTGGKWAGDLELAFHAGPGDYADFMAAVGLLSELRRSIRYIEFFSDHAKSTRPEEIADFVKKCRQSFPGAKIGGGTDYDFTEINRYRFDAGLFDFVVYSICPQVHAGDDDSLIENLAAQAETVHSARAIYPGKDIHASVVSLLRRSNPDATSKPEPSGSGSFDERQYTVFGGQWALCSLKYLAESGVPLVTLFEAAGNRGLVREDGQRENLRRNDNRSVGRSPYSYLLEIIQQCRVTGILPVLSSRPLNVEAVLFQADRSYLLALINFSDQSEEIMTDEKMRILGSSVFDHALFLEREEKGYLGLSFSIHEDRDAMKNAVSVPPHSLCFCIIQLVGSIPHRTST